MLVLTRNINEIIYIGNEVKLTILGIRGNQVRIGIEAPRNIPILQEELYLSQQQDEEKAGKK